MVERGSFARYCSFIQLCYTIVSVQGRIQDSGITKSLDRHFFKKFQILKGVKQMGQFHIGKHILDLRKELGITQEELALAINISPQAVSKWETDTCFPDTQTLPLIAAYFNVSIDYLFYGENAVYDDVYEKVQQRVASYPQMSKEAYEEAHKLFAAAIGGVVHGCAWGKNGTMCDEPLHVSGKNGLSLISRKGYGTIVTKGFFENITKETLDFSKSVLEALAEPNAILVISVIVSMSGISRMEMEERTGLSKEEVQRVLDVLISCGIVSEEESKHKALGKIYQITDMYHTCICIFLTTLEIQRDTLNGISCYMEIGDYPVKVTEDR